MGPAQCLLVLCLSVLMYWVTRPASDLQMDLPVQPWTCIITWKLSYYLYSWLDLDTGLLSALCGYSGTGCWLVISLSCRLLLSLGAAAMQSFLILTADSNFARAACDVEQFMGLCTVFFGTTVSSFIHSIGMY